MAEWRAALGLEDDVPAYRVKEAIGKRGGKSQSYEDRPPTLEGVPQLQPDLLALDKLFESDEPVHRLVRGDKVGTAKIAFGDASGGGFGSSCESSVGVNAEEDDHVGYRFGT